MSRKEELKELLSFTSGEKKGVLVLIALIVIVILVNIFVDFKSHNETADFKPFEDEVLAFEA